MKAKIEIERPDRIRITMSDGKEISILITSENRVGEHLRVTGDGSMIVRPSASNQVRISVA